MAITEPTGRDQHEVAEVIPQRCANGHPLTAGNVLIGGDCEIRTVLCRECGSQLTSRHGSDDWIAKQKARA